MFNDFSLYYILDDNNNVVKCTDIYEWSKYFATKKRFLFKNTKDRICVSTVFLGIDHSHEEGAEPLIFETMVFNGDMDLDCCRFSTYTDATAGHVELCEKYGIYYTNPNKDYVINTIDDLE